MPPYLGMFDFVIEQHAHRRRVCIVILAAFHVPNEDQEESYCDGQAYSDKQNDDGHVLIYVSVELGAIKLSKDAPGTRCICIWSICFKGAEFVCCC